ncbi:hypothetical protein [Kitasatospora sp. NPDC088351]|uniref:hypothetical protein n=1 Tax=Kitasatospora sp. NPDC088351 TaxID=3155180 RepID=UPI0034452A5C
MPTAHRGAVRRLLTVAGLLSVVLYTEGQWESRSGGRMLVADLLNRPEPLLGSALAALITAAWLGGRRTAARTAVRAVAVTAGVLFLIGVLAVHVSAADETRSRQDAPTRPERTLVVVHRSYGSETEANSWQILLETGSGWSGRRWSLGTVDGRFPGEGAFLAATWTGPDQVTVVTDTHRRVFNVDPDTGEPVEAR